MSFCINCGTQLPDHAKFCNECGTKQEVIEKKQPSADKPSYKPTFRDIDDDAEIAAPDSDKESPAPQAATKIKPPVQKAAPLFPEYDEMEEAPEEDNAEEMPVEESSPIEEEKPEEISKAEEVVDSRENDNSVDEESKDTGILPPEETSQTEEKSDSASEEENADKNFLLHLLSSYKNNTSAPSEKEATQSETPGFSNSTDYAEDPYWDDVKPEIDNEIYQIDRSMILKGVGCVCALFLVIAYLIYMI